MSSLDDGTDMTSDIRKRALAVLNDHQNKSPTVIHNAILDLRRNPERGDERILHPFLGHPDPMVVAATLETLSEVHNQRALLRSVIERLARNGDERESDDLDRPIQCMAIELLAAFGKQDDAAVSTLLEVAESETIGDAPRACAWERLAYLYDADWPSDATEELILRPASESSERIRNCIRQAMQR